MNNLWKIIIVLILAASVVAVVWLKKTETQPPKTIADSNSVIIQNTEMTKIPVNLPRLVDLGADKCIPCKMMAPILEELKVEYKNNLEVLFIDVWKEPKQGHKYNVRLIPTQIFFDADGKELYRNEGFFSKEDILGKWKELGFDLDK